MTKNGPARSMRDECFVIADAGERIAVKPTFRHERRLMAVVSTGRRNTLIFLEEMECMR